MTEPTFRAPKRRKVFRSRPKEENEDEHGAIFAQKQYPTPEIEPVLSQGQAREEPEEDGEQYSSVADILRRRKAGKQRKAGIEFTSTKTTTFADPITSQLTALVPVDNGQSVMEKATGRFTAQTGQVADVMDKHMVSYIDAKMAKLRESANALEASGSAANGEGRTPSGLLRTRQPAGVGKLLEIDLGPDATLKNIARTQAAQKRLEAGEPEAQNAGPQRKPRLGRDGKPWRSRKRRNSEDIARDKMVEDIMRESRLEKYEEPVISDTVEDDQAADDRIAEQFRKDFLDQVASKNVRKPAPAASGAASKAEGPKGPKMGGSRSVRAAMRLQEEKAAKKR
ncbi:hypothetical protein EJ08DRAFT_663381 [Tothia fuscella]|uniref:Hepatocellular carcinoma-associated antigen 59-domain-containing protein n=1 Tax=Tothia fuscella TaxID=1048955 RepID=A0A9P4NKP9_9PEZI|nr:hypothetical protein EJ08DRAFT_663381 [Tothia fuscella]